METKKFVLILVAIIGLTIVAERICKSITKVEIQRIISEGADRFCSHRVGPRHSPYCPNRYSRPLPVKTYFKYIPPRHKIRHRRRSRNIC